MAPRRKAARRWLVGAVACTLAPAASPGAFVPIRANHALPARSSSEFVGGNGPYHWRPVAASPQRKRLHGPELDNLGRTRVDIRSANSADGGSGSSPRSPLWQLLVFALPGLGIYIADPIMTNVDNAFVGRFSGTEALAALGPGNAVSNQLLFLCSVVLSSASTGIVSRTWAKEDGVDKTRKAVGGLLTMAVLVGLSISCFCFFAGAGALRWMGTQEALIAHAMPYVLVRSWATAPVLLQAVCLSSCLATRDSRTPLLIILAATFVNLLGDVAFCVWPFRWGVVGAALGTVIAHFFGCFMMLLALHRKRILPRPRFLTLSDLSAVTTYAGPILLVMTARVIGNTSMAVAATSLGTVPLAAYQVTVGIFSLFATAPLSQICQAVLPPVIDRGDPKEVRHELMNVMKLAMIVSASISIICTLALSFGARSFTSDPAVLLEISRVVPAIFISTSTFMITNAVDGSLVAAKDFRFLMMAQLAVISLQVCFLNVCKQRSLPLVYNVLSFPGRLILFVGASCLRIWLGYGPLGRLVRAPAAKKKLHWRS